MLVTCLKKSRSTIIIYHHYLHTETWSSVSKTAKLLTVFDIVDIFGFVKIKLMNELLVSKAGI